MVTPLMASSNAPGSIMSLTICFETLLLSLAPLKNTEDETHGPLDSALGGRVLGVPFVGLCLGTSRSSDLEARKDVLKYDLRADEARSWWETSGQPKRSEMRRPFCIGPPVTRTRSEGAMLRCWMRWERQEMRRRL